MNTTTNPDISEELIGSVQNVITQADNDFLVSIPSEKKIFDTLKNMEPWKVPGPDGFPLGFYQP